MLKLFQASSAQGQHPAAPSLHVRGEGSLYIGLRRIFQDSPIVVRHRGRLVDGLSIPSRAYPGTAREPS